MRRSEIIFGSIVLVAGVLLLFGALFDIDIWGLICPAGLIGLGVWLIYRTRKDPSEGDVNIKFVGDLKRSGVWEAQSEETWGFVLDSKLDFSNAVIPNGETILRLGAFVNELKATIPNNVGVAIYSMAFMTDSENQRRKAGNFFRPIRLGKR